MHSNILGVQAAVIAIIAYAFALRRAPRATLWWTLFVVATVVVYLTKARTALITVVFGTVAVYVVGRPIRDAADPAAAFDEVVREVEAAM